MDSNISRRQALSRIGAVGLGVTGSGAVLLGDSVQSVRAWNSYDSPDKEWTKTDQAFPNNYMEWKVAQASTLGWFGGIWRGGREWWQHDFRIQSDVRSEKTDSAYIPGQSVQRISAMELGITQGTTDDLRPSTHDDYHGVHPTPNSDRDGNFNYKEAGYELAKTAILTLNPIANFAYSAGMILDALTPAWPKTNHYAYGNEIDYAREGGVSDAGFFRWFYPYTRDKSVFDLFVKSGDRGMGAETDIQYTIHIESDHRPEEGRFPGLSSVNTTKTKIGTTLYSPKDGWLVEKIPPEKIPQRAQSLGLHRREVKTHLENNDEPLYYAHQMPMTVQ